MNKQKKIIIAIECALENISANSSETISNALQECEITNTIISLDINHILSLCRASNHNKEELNNDELFCEILKREFVKLIDDIQKAEAEVIICPNYIDYIKLNSDYFNQKRENLSEELVNLIEKNNASPVVTIVYDISSVLMDEELRRVFKDVITYRFEEMNIDSTENTIHFLNFYSEKNDQYLNYFKNKGENCFILDSCSSQARTLSIILNKLIN